MDQAYPKKIEQQPNGLMNMNANRMMKKSSSGRNVGRNHVVAGFSPR
jgi:hypothetical protein